MTTFESQTIWLCLLWYPTEAKQFDQLPLWNAYIVPLIGLSLYLKVNQFDLALCETLETHMYSLLIMSNNLIMLVWFWHMPQQEVKQFDCTLSEYSNGQTIWPTYSLECIEPLALSPALSESRPISLCSLWDTAWRLPRISYWLYVPQLHNV